MARRQLLLAAALGLAAHAQAQTSSPSTSAKDASKAEVMVLAYSAGVQGKCTGDVQLLATFPQTTQGQCQSACMDDPACLAASMQNVSNANCYLFETNGGTMPPNFNSPDSSNPEICYKKTGPKCTAQMTQLCQTTATSAYSCVLQDLTKGRFQCVVLDRCKIPSVPTGGHGQIVCDTTGAVYMDFYQFDQMQCDKDAQHFTDQGTCQFACDDGYTMQSGVTNSYSCGASGFEPNSNVPACVLTDPCLGANNPCKNGGKCDDTRGGSSANPYSCRCTAGWAGQNCDYADACQTSTTGNTTCTTNGACRAMSPGTGLGCAAGASSCGFNCICDPLVGWSGNQCQCPPAGVSNSQPANPCKHGAASAVVIAGKCSWSCDCTGVPWSGTYCEQAPQQCSDPSYCKSGGTCKNILNSATGQRGDICECPTGFSGATCTDQSSSKNCKPGACANGGTCVDMFNQFRCLCDGAWGGPKCTSYDSVNDCATSPCKNGATCNDQYQGVTCECSQGWGGTRCQLSSKNNPCTNNNPCKNGGTCSGNWVNDEYVAVCACPSRTYGDNCENVDTHDDCTDQPCCSQGGNCVDLFKDAICVCSEGWDGGECNRRMRDKCTLTTAGPTCAAGAAPFRAHQTCRAEGGTGGQAAAAKAAPAKTNKSSGHGFLWFCIIMIILGGVFFGLWHKGMLPAAIADKLPAKGAKAVGPQAGLYDSAPEAGSSMNAPL